MAGRGNGWNAVTGASGYSGKYITQELLRRGEQVKTFMRYPERGTPFGAQVPVFPLSFNDLRALTEHLRGAKVLYNTYWIRFEHRGDTFAQAIENTRRLLQAAKTAGVPRVVHLSVTNADPHSQLPYYRGKAIVEQEVRDSGLSYAIIRPTVIYGHEDILINNAAWCLRRFPCFAIPGRGTYCLQPVFVEDMVCIAVEAGQRSDNIICDAAGPDTLTFTELVRQLGQAISSRAWILHAPPRIALAASQMIGRMVGDIVLTREELEGLMANLLVSSAPPLGTTRFADWLRQHRADVGVTYASELHRHFSAAGR